MACVFCADDEVVVIHAQFFFYADNRRSDCLRMVTYYFLFEDL